MTKNEAQMIGRSFRARGQPITLLDSEYADDTAVVFDNRHDDIVETQSLVSSSVLRLFPYTTREKITIKLISLISC